MLTMLLIGVWTFASSIQPVKADPGIIIKVPEDYLTDMLLYSDAVYAELVPGQNVQLVFALPQQISEARTYIIVLEGYYYTIEQ